MIINFQSHSDYVMATTILVSSIDQANIFNELTSLFYEANKPLGTKRLDDIQLSKKEIKIIRNNNEKLCEVLNMQPDNTKLEDLIHSFCDITVAVEYIREQNT
jgi:5-bromo-4-chloroindolyl phosphate hydrolysis protein